MQFVVELVETGAEIDILANAMHTKTVLAAAADHSLPCISFSPPSPTEGIIRFVFTYSQSSQSAS